MRSSLRALWLGVKASYWFLPSLLTLAALLLSQVTIHLDLVWGSEWLMAFDWLQGSRPEGARAQLTVIASGMIAIASTVFAITIAAVAYASGNYGPRLLNNFMNDRGNQLSLGVFIATFVYNLMVLRVIRDPQDAAAPGESSAAATSAFVPQLSMLISGVSVLMAVAVLVFFLHHVPASIRINTVLGGIGRRLVRDIERRFPREGGWSEPGQAPRGAAVTAKSIGYVEIIDFRELDQIACESGITIVLKIRTGDFIHPHLTIAETSGGEADQGVHGRIRGCFSLGDSRTPTQDLEFLIDELVEIGLRALSPGVNDPFTAVTCIHWIGAALAKLADRDLGEGPEQGHYDRKRVRPIADEFSHYVRRGYGALRPSAAADQTAAKLFLESLCGVALGATSAERRKVLLEEGRTLVRQAETELKGPALEEVRERLRSFERQVEEIGR